VMLSRLLSGDALEIKVLETINPHTSSTP